MAEEAVHRYGTKVSFKQGVPLKFPDFTLTYIGERRVSSKQYPRGFLNHDFVASTKSARITLSWSAGTGDIGPAVFTIAGKEFWLELTRSDALGRLKSDELVVSIKQ